VRVAAHPDFKCLIVGVAAEFTAFHFRPHFGSSGYPASTQALNPP
jgi:hypothetical protein